MIRFCEIEAKIHDEFMQTHPKEHFMQCSLWAEVKKTSGWTSSIVGLYQDEKLVASSLLLFRTIPLIHSKICYAPRGYVIDFDNQPLVRMFTDKLKEYCKKKNVCYIMIDPDYPYRILNAKEEVIATHPSIIANLECLGYKHQGFNVGFDMTQPRYTFRLKLNQSKEETFANYSKIIRTSMNNASRIGIECKKEENVDAFYDIMQVTAERNHFVERNKDYYQDVYHLFHAQNMSTCYSATYHGQTHLEAMNAKEKELNDEIAKLNQKLETSPQDTKSSNRIKQIETQKEKLAKDQEKAREFIQEYPDGLTLSGGITINTQHRAWLVYGGNRTVMREVGANYAIKQFEIEDDIDKHFEFVDFFGTIGNPTPESEHIGIHEFKKKFNGDYWEFPGEFHFVLNPMHYALWVKAAPKAKQLMRTLKKRKKQNH